MSARILLVEDEANMVRTLSRILERAGYEVATAANGKEALGILDRDVIDVLITDLNMPVMDGMALLRAMQEAGARLMARPQLGKDIFSRGQPEGVVVIRRAVWDVKLYDLLQAYGHQVRPKDADTYQIAPMQFFSVEEAAERLGRMLGIAIDWQTLEAFLPAGLTDPTKRRSAIASTFVAGLQLAKDGQIELRQTERFGPIHLRKRTEQR